MIYCQRKMKVWKRRKDFHVKSFRDGTKFFCTRFISFPLLRDLLQLIFYKDSCLVCMLWFPFPVQYTAFLVQINSTWCFTGSRWQLPQWYQSKKRPENFNKKWTAFRKLITEGASLAPPITAFITESVITCW